MYESPFGHQLEPSLEKAMAIHSSTLAWKIPWMEECARLQSMGSQRVRHGWVTSLSLLTLEPSLFLELDNRTFLSEIVRLSWGGPWRTRRDSGFKTLSNKEGEMHKGTWKGESPRSSDLWGRGHLQGREHLLGFNLNFYSFTVIEITSSFISAILAFLSQFFLLKFALLIIITVHMCSVASIMLNSFWLYGL